eukprot:4157822-Alexandrium_andersonii.AAC.1
MAANHSQWQGMSPSRKARHACARTTGWGAILNQQMQHPEGRYNDNANARANACKTLHVAAPWLPLPSTQKNKRGRN